MSLLITFGMVRTMWQIIALKKNSIILLAALVGSASAIASDKVYISVD